MLKMLHFVQVQQTQYILAQNYVMAFAIAALGSLEFVEPPRTATSQIPYGQLFDEHKMYWFIIKSHSVRPTVCRTQYINIICTHIFSINKCTLFWIFVFSFFRSRPNSLTWEDHYSWIIHGIQDLIFCINKLTYYRRNVDLIRLRTLLPTYVTFFQHITTIHNDHGVTQMFYKKQHVKPNIYGNTPKG